MSILVCGGAGYIGSHTVKELIGKYEVVVLYNLSKGFPFLLECNICKWDLGDDTVLVKSYTNFLTLSYLLEI